MSGAGERCSSEIGFPNLVDDMHGGSVNAEWAKANNSLLIVTWDESDDYFFPNRIPMIFYGANVKTGTYNEKIDHCNLLSTLEQMYGLPKIGQAANAPAIADIWG